MNRALTNAVWERHCKVSRRVLVARNEVCNCRALHSTTVPGYKHRIGLLNLIANIHCTACAEQYNHLPATLLYSIEQRLLCLRHSNLCKRSCLASLRVPQTKREQHNIGLLGYAYSLLDTALNRLVEIRPLGVENIFRTVALLDSSECSYRVISLTKRNPSANLVAWSVSQWTNHSNLLYIFERKYTVVREQHHRLGCNLACILQVLWAIYYILVILATILEWIVEQSEAILYSQNFATELIDSLLRNFTLVNQRLAIGNIVAIDHIHIEVSIHCLLGSLFAIGCCAVLNLLVYCIIVRNNKAIETQLLTQ